MLVRQFTDLRKGDVIKVTVLCWPLLWGNITACIVKCTFSLGFFVCVNTVVCKGRQTVTRCLSPRTQ